MADLKDYISFDIPPFLAGEEGVHVLNDEMRANVEAGFREMALTEEGAELLELALEKSVDGTISVLFIDGGEGNSLFWNKQDVAGDNKYDLSIFLGDKLSIARYYSPETDAYEDVSVQRFLWHEVGHMALSHDEIYPDEVFASGGPSVMKESEAISVSNYGMTKYYAEPERVLDAREFGYANFQDHEGNAEFSLNENFRVEGYPTPSIEYQEMRDAVLQLSSEDAAACGPEVEALYVYKDHPEKFEAQAAEFLEHGGAACDLLGVGNSEDVQKVSAPEPEPVPAEGAAVSYDGGVKSNF